MPSIGEGEEPVFEGWERLETSTGIPYYSNKRLQKTQWDHPMMKRLESELKELDQVRFVAYRTALKLRAVQKNTRMSLIKLTLVKEVLLDRGLDRQADGAAQTVDVSDVQAIVHSLYERAQNDTWGQVPRKHCAELMINWLLNVYDCGRTGKMRVMSLKVGIATLSQARLLDKYIYLFEQICSVDSRVDKDSLKSLLKDWLLIARQLVKIECRAFGGNSPKAGVDSCFQYVRAPEDRNTIDLREYLVWLHAEPQTIVFLPTMHRLAAAETMKHDAKCNECKDFPIVGMRFRSMKHVNVDLCQGCFFSCRGMNNKPENAKYYHEYCVPATSGEDIKDFAGALVNKVTKGHRRKQPAFLIVNGSEADEDNSETQRSPAMRPVSEVHEEIRDLADNLQDLEELPAETRPDDDDEHELIRRYSERLSEGMLATPTHRVLEDSGEKVELERNIQELEENRLHLEDELGNLKLSLEKQKQEQEQQEQARSDRDARASAFVARERLDKEILEARIEVLEEHNVRLMAQLQKLRQLLQHRERKSPPAPSPQVQSSSPKELTPVPVVHVSAVPPESLTAVSEENQVQGVVINSMAEFPDLLADAPDSGLFANIYDAARAVGDVMTEFVTDMSSTGL